MSDIIGFVYCGHSPSELARSILQYSIVYQVPVVAIPFSNLIDHFHGKPLIAEYWNDQCIAFRESSLPSILDSEYNSFSEKALHQNDAGFLDWLKSKNAQLLRQFSCKKEAIPQLLLPTELYPYAIPTWNVSTYPELLRYLSCIKDAVLKPCSGRKGKGVSKLFRQNDGSIILKDKNGKRILNEAVFSEYLSSVQEQNLGNMFLVQPCLDFTLDEDHAVDFRLLRHRGSSGQWEEVATYARIGASSLVSNVSQGGFIADAKETLQTISGDHAETLYEEIMTIGDKLPRVIQNCGKETVFCLGLDIAIDRKTMQPFILEANTYPGTKFHARQLAEKRVQYYKYILNKAKSN